VQEDNQETSTGPTVFISYSRKNKEFARKLHKTLEAYRPPKDLAKRRLSIVRDEGDLSGTDYYQAIERHLRQSTKLIILCSPEARESLYVNDEIRRFLAANNPEDLIPILIKGIPNNEATPGAEEHLAFPPALCEALELPLAVDYRGFDPRHDKINKAAYYEPWCTILANIYGQSRSTIEQRERKRQNRRRAITGTIITAIITVLSIALVVAPADYLPTDRVGLHAIRSSFCPCRL
jgi:hypothetical protein